MTPAAARATCTIPLTKAGAAAPVKERTELEDPGAVLALDPFPLLELLPFPLPLELEPEL